MSIPVSQTKLGEIKKKTCLETPEERFERDSHVYNIQAVSFTPAELVEEMRKHLSNFVVEYHPIPTSLFLPRLQCTFSCRKLDVKMLCCLLCLMHS